jgi:hypothetical protein
MPVTSTPQAVTPALWTYTYLQAPINGQGYSYFNIPSQFTDLGTVSSGTATLDLSLANIYRVQVGGNITLAFSNIAATTNSAQFWQLEIKAGGSYTITWPSSIKWDGGGASNLAPVLSSNTTLLNFYTRNNGTTVYGGYAFSDITN